MLFSCGVCNRWRMRPRRERVAGVARHWVAVVRGAGDLGGVEADVCLFVFGVAAIRLSEQRSRHIRSFVVAVERRSHVGTDFGAGLTRGYADGSTVAVEVCPKATACSAACRDGGSDFPRFSARRSIPAHAVPLKKNLGGIEPFSSTCDNEHTAASLGQGEKLGVEDAPRDCSFGAKHTTSVCPFSPWWFQWIIFSGKSSKKAAEGVVFGAEDARDVFPEYDALVFTASSSNIVNCICYLHKFEG